MDKTSVDKFVFEFLVDPPHKLAKSLKTKPVPEPNIIKDEPIIDIVTESVEPPPLILEVLPANSTDNIDIEAIKQNSFDEGYQKAQLEAKQQQENLTNELLERINTQLALSKNELDVITTTTKQEAIKIALYAANKLANKALLENYQLELNNLLQQALALLPEHQSATLVVNPEIAKIFSENSSSFNFNGQLSYEANEQMPLHDFKLSYDHTLIEVNKEHLWQQINKLFEQ